MPFGGLQHDAYPQQLPLLRGARTKPAFQLRAFLRPQPSYILASRTYLGCSGHRNKHICSNRRTITMGEVEDRVLYALQRYLLAPEVVAASIEVYRQERQKRAKDLARERGTLDRELGELTRKIDRLVQSIQDGADTKGITLS